MKAAPLRVEETFSRYNIVRKLGQGMSAVYLAQDLELDKLVVLKIVEDRGDHVSRLALESECRGTALQQRLHHRDPRILEIFDTGERNGCFFAVMEYFPGRTLAEIVQVEGCLDPRRAAFFAAESCNQLRTLHEFVSEESGLRTPVVHGDVKPSNIQIDDQGQLRLLDFGIAKVITSGHDLTHHDLGSPSYCSPERLRKSEVDVHADLWALGVSLYEMLAGEPPFQAQDTRQLEELIQSRRPPRILPESCPVNLQAVVSKALTGNLSKRYASAEKFEADLRAFLEGRPTEALREKANSRGNLTVDRSLNVATTPSEPALAHLPSGGLADRIPGVTGTSKSASGLFGVVIALSAGVLAGLALFIPAMYFLKARQENRTLLQPKNYVSLLPSVLAADWQLYQNAKSRSAWINSLSSFDESEASLHANLVHSAEKVLSGFRQSPDDKLANFAWVPARLCLLHALQINGADNQARGELHLCDGYSRLARSNEQSMTLASVRDFQRAAALMPLSADPHLALARVYAHGLHNIGTAMPEYRRAEELGYSLGARELEQQADGFLYRGEAELTRAKKLPQASKVEALRLLRAGISDIDRAQDLYDSIANSRSVSVKLEQASEDRIEQVHWETEFSKPALRPKPVAHRSRKGSAKRHADMVVKVRHPKRTVSRP